MVKYCARHDSSTIQATHKSTFALESGTSGIKIKKNNYAAVLVHTQNEFCKLDKETGFFNDLGFRSYTKNKNIVMVLTRLCYCF